MFFYFPKHPFSFTDMYLPFGLITSMFWALRWVLSCFLCLLYHCFHFLFWLVTREGACWALKLPSWRAFWGRRRCQVCISSSRHVCPGTKPCGILFGRRPLANERKAKCEIRKTSSPSSLRYTRMNIINYPHTNTRKLRADEESSCEKGKQGRYFFEASIYGMLEIPLA